MTPGMCVVTEMYDAATDTRRLRIDQADEHIEATQEVIDALTERGWAGEGLFRIEAENGSVTYQLLDYRPASHTWGAKRRTAWPPNDPYAHVTDSNNPQGDHERRDD